jgi:hypothetical protein
MATLEKMNIKKLTISVFGPEQPDHPNYTLDIDTLITDNDNEPFEESYFYQKEQSTLELCLVSAKKWCVDRSIEQIPIIRVYLKDPNMSFNVDLNYSLIQ